MSSLVEFCLPRTRGPAPSPLGRRRRLLVLAGLLLVAALGALGSARADLAKMYPICSAEESPLQAALPMDTTVARGQREMLVNGRARITIEFAQEGGECRVLSTAVDRKLEASPLRSRLMSYCKLVGGLGEHDNALSSLANTKKFVIQFHANLVPFNLRVWRRQLFGNRDLFKRACLKYYVPQLGAGTIVTLRRPVRPGKYHLEFAFTGVEKHDIAAGEAQQQQQQ